MKQKLNDTIDITNDTIDTIDTNDIIVDTDTNRTLDRTLIVGPSFCGRTHLLLNKLHLIGLDNPKQQKK